MASQKQKLKQAVTVIRDNLKRKIDQSEKLEEKAFTARSRDIGITNPDIQRDVSKKQVVRGAIGAAFVAADYKLNPDKYSLDKLKDKASRAAFASVVREGENIVNRLLPEGVSLNLNIKDIDLEKLQEGRRPAVGVRYERPVEFGGLKGSAGVQGRYDPESGETFVGAGLKGRFAKGGKVKQYAKGGGVRKPRLK